MDRIHHSSALATPPSVDDYASAGYPTEGNPTSGQQATILTAWVVHSLIEEIRNVIVAAGITPSKSVLTQLNSALSALFGGGGTLGTNGWQKLPGGLILQWGQVGASADVSGSAILSVSGSLPIAFPNAAYQVVGAVIDAGAGGATVTTANMTTTTVTFSVEEFKNLIQALNVRYIALGR